VRQQPAKGFLVVQQPEAQPAPNPAQTYEDYLVPHQFRPWTEELLARATPALGERVLDVACGTGIVARTVVQRLGEDATVTGLDLNPAMIDVARAAAEQEGVVIAWHVGRADALPFPDGTFDLVLIQQGLQFFPDKPAAVREVVRVLAPGGRLGTATWAEIAANPFFESLAAAVERHLGTSALQTPFSLAEEDVLRSILVEAGLIDIVIERVTRTVRFPDPARFINLGLASAAAAVPAMQTMDATERARLTEAVRADMQEPLERYTDGDEVVFPLVANITVAHRSA